MSDASDPIDLPALLARAPDPERAARLVERVVDGAGSRLVGLPRAGVERVLHACCGVAPFLAPWLIAKPEWLAELAADDLARPLAREDLEPRLAAGVASAPAREAERALREFKYRWLARITVRDCCEEIVPLARSGETLSELTILAELLVEQALRVARQRVAERLGPPRWRDGAGGETSGGFVVLGLGKLGGEELNYSSDVDLVYVYQSVADGDTGPQTRAPADYWSFVVRELNPLVASETAERFLYRIDLDLRPEGAQGPAVISEEALVHYYETAADQWEKVAFMKARPVAGDLELGWRVVRAVDPMIYQAAMDPTGVRRIRDLKERIGRERSGRGGFDVKLGPGGIRDVEFVAQALQLLHGARIPQLRHRSTARALERLAEVRVLPRPRADALLEAYRFLRRLENRLQMEEERQVHRLPEGMEAQTRIARAFGFSGSDTRERLLDALDGHRRRVVDAAAAFGHERGADAIVELFLRHQPRLFAQPETRAQMEALTHAFAREIEGSADPELAIANLDRFVEGVGSRRFYYELLLDRPELVRRLAALFASSRYLSELLARHPRLIEPLFADPNVLLLSREQLRADLASLREGAPDDTEHQLAALRLFHHRQVLNVGLLDVDEKISRAACEIALTEVAEVTLEGALDLARREVERVRPPSPAARAAHFLVVGMGKLASRELSYGSDLDLLFLYDLAPERGDDLLEAQEYCVHLAQRLISALETPTTDGTCYEIDSRLRPSGNQGTLVTSLATLAAYHEEGAQTWERQALLRARPAVGDPEAAAAFEALRLAILRRPLPADAAAEIHRIRLRMERELTQETRGRRDLKRGRGGLLDVESAVQYLQLRHGAAHPDVLTVERTERTIDRLAETKLLAPDLAAVLRDGWEFLQRLASRMRILENRSISDLDAGSGDLDVVARRLGYGGPREASARAALLRDYTSHTEAIRRAYLEILGVAP
jgi:glutamate-ammonia-ligase adenylyltransferase